MVNEVQMKFDIERSLKESPPEYPKGVHFMKRIVVNRNNLVRNYQVRNLVLAINNIAPIRKSYETYGVLYDEPVKGTEVNDDDSKKLNLLSGYTRDAAEEELSWSHTMVDILKFDTPRIRRSYMYKENRIKNPRTGNTKADLAKGVVDGIAAGDIENTDEDILNFLEESDDSKTPEERQAILKLARKTKSPFAHMVPLDGNRAGKLLNDLGHQYGGIKNKNVDGIAYARPSGFSRNAFVEGLELAKKYSHDGLFATVTIYGYIENPTPKKLKADRMAWRKDFHEYHNKMVDIVALSQGISLEEAEKVVVSPFVFGGFLPQDQTPNQQNRFKETALVDEYGNPFMG